MKTILVDAWGTFVTEEGMFLEMYELLESYPNTKIIVTNANEEEMPKYNIVDMPYDVFTMSHNPNKDNPVFYETVLEKYGLKPEDVVCFDRTEEFVKSARSLGITTYHYDPKKRDLEALKKFLDKNL